LFINTGGWVRECAEEKRNTFLYIDTEAPHLLTWDKAKVANGELTCLEDFKGRICLAPFCNHEITQIFTRKRIKLTYFQYTISYFIPK
jgi:hypothetical protein